MKCNKCGTNNSQENKFCIQCGSELKKIIDGLSCPNCGSTNKQTNKFCIDCGTEINIQNKVSKPAHRHKAAPNRSRKYSSQKRLPLLDFLQENKVVAAIGLLIVAFVIFQMLPSNKSTRIPRYYNQNNNTNLAGFGGNKVMDIASKFICPCGTCDRLSLETCQCPSAKEEKAFIKSQVDAQKSDLEIIKTVNAKYGWIKAQFKDLLTATENKVNGSQKTNTGTSGSLKLSSNGGRLATMLDLSYIIEQFKCPCGQCGVDELKDCSCNHPNGSVEVKSFIRNKINTNSFTVNQIIAEVDKTYGGKKI